MQPLHDAARRKYIMDYVKRLTCALVILGLAAALTGCPEEEVHTFIYAFGQKQIPVGLNDSVDVILSQAVQEEKLYVEISNNTNPSVVEASYGAASNSNVVIKFKRGDVSKTVNLKALKAGDAAITFKIRDTSQFSILAVKVVPVTYSDGLWDSGKLRDYAGMEAGADKGTGDKGTGDKGTTTPDKGTGDAKTTTPDKSTATPDAGAGG